MKILYFLSLLSLLIVQIKTQTYHTNIIPRITDNQFYSGSVTLDRITATTTTFNFQRYGLLTTSDYQVGMSVSFANITGVTSVNVTIRSYVNDTARLILRSGTENDYTTSITNNPGTLLAAYSINPNKTNTFFSLPLTTVSSKCEHQNLTSNWIAVDFFIPTVAVANPSIVVNVAFKWEYIYLNPIDVFYPYLKNLPVLEKPRTLITNLSNTVDSDNCADQITASITFTRPSEAYVTQYWIYLVRVSDTVANTPALPSTGDGNVPRVVTVASLQSSVNLTVTFTNAQMKSSPFFFVVYTANQAGRDDTGVSTSGITNAALNPNCNTKDGGVKETFTVLQRKRDWDEDNQEQQQEEEIKIKNIESELLQEQQEQQEQEEEEEIKINDVESELLLQEKQLQEQEHQLLQQERRHLQQKYTTLNSNSITTAANATHSSNFAYRREINGYISDYGTHHLYKVSVGDMATFNLTMTYSYTNKVNSTNIISGIALIGESVPACIYGMTTTEINTLSQTSSYVDWIPTTCPTTLTSGNTFSSNTIDSYGVQTIISCSGTTEGTIIGTITVNYYQFCSTPSDIFNKFRVMILSQSGTEGNYKLVFELTDYSTNVQYLTLGSIFATGPQLSNVQSSTFSTALASLITTRSGYPSQILSTSSYSTTTLETKFQVTLSTNSTYLVEPVATLLETTSQITLTDYNTLLRQVFPSLASSLLATSVVTRAKPTILANGCVAKGQSRTFPIGFSSCAHPILNVALVSGSVTGIYVKKNAVPNAVSYDAVAVYPVQQLSTQDSCVRTPSVATSGFWNGQVFLLSNQNVLNATAFTVSLSLSQITGYTGERVDGYTCCSQLMLHSVSVPANKRLQITLTTSTIANPLAVILQRDSCPVSDIIQCTASSHCFYVTSPVNGSFYIQVPLASVQSSTSQWCVGVQAKDSSTAHAVSYTLQSSSTSTPAPTPTTVPSYDPCSPQDLFCRRNFIQSSDSLSLNYSLCFVVMWIPFVLQKILL